MIKHAIQKKKIQHSNSTSCIFCLRYCLDNRDAITKDSQLSSLQSSHVKFETLSTCVQRDHRPLETRSTRAVTKAAKNDTKQSLMKLSVPLMRTKAAGKGKRPAAVER